MSKFFDWVKREIAAKLSVPSDQYDLSGNIPINKLLVSTGLGSLFTLVDNTIPVWVFKTSSFTCDMGKAYTIDVGNTDILLELPQPDIDNYPLLLKVRIDSSYNKTVIVRVNDLSSDTIDNQNDTLAIDFSTDLILIFDSTNNNWRV